MAWVMDNGICKSDENPSVSHLNRAFLYGDGCFESIRVSAGKVLFVETHFERLMTTLKAMDIYLAESYDLSKFKSELEELVEINKIKNGGRLRATFSRAGGGHYTPERNDADRFLTVVPLSDNQFTLNSQGLRIDIYSKMKKEINFLSNFKTLNCQLYVMAALHAKNQGLDDAILLNQSGGIIETTNSNLFVVSNRVLYTPAISQGCVAGTMRMQLINLAITRGLKVYECNISPQHLLAADELFATNAISGLRWIGAYRTKRYTNNMSKQLIEWLNEGIG